MAAIHTDGIGKRYGDIVALDGIDLQIDNGSFFGLFGPNGAGKTTLLKILTGQTEPTAGKATVLGFDVIESPMEVKKLVGIVPEVESPPSYLTAYEYLYFVGKVRRVQELDNRIERWIDFFDLHEVSEIICKDLSKGMRQMLMLAAAFIHEPPLLFLDEPFINLDPIYQKKVREYLLDYSSNGGTIFMCSHILEIAEKICTDIAIIDRGRIVAQGTMEELRQESENLSDVFLRLVQGGNEG